jgi:hypothetical protein
VRSFALPLIALGLGVAGCSHGAPSGAAASASASAPVLPASTAPLPASPAAPAGPVAAAAANHNPLGLPSVRLALDAGRRVFTVPEQVLIAARPGSTLVLKAATVTGIEGDDLIIDGAGGPTYKVHAGYAIAVPDAPRLKPGDPVITEHHGALRHAVVTKFIRDRIGVRFTDLDGRSHETLLLAGSGKPTAAGPSKAARMIKQVEGLAPGNYAARKEGGEWHHVLLVSAFGEGDARRWLVLGFGGAARIVAEADLAPIPVRFNAKPGKVVWAESSGKMRRATILSADDQGLFSVKFERAGRPTMVGWGLVMMPLPG